MVVLEGEAASSAEQGSSRLGPWVGSSSTDTGVLDYHRQFRQPAHENMMVDEPWDALKGEVGPVLASIAPSPGQRGVRPDVWHVAPRSFLLLLLRLGKAMAKGGPVRDWDWARWDMFQEKEEWDKTVYGTRFWYGFGNRATTAVVRVNGQPGGQPAWPSVSLPARVGKSAS